MISHLKGELQLKKTNRSISLCDKIFLSKITNDLEYVTKHYRNLKIIHKRKTPFWEDIIEEVDLINDEEEERVLKKAKCR